LIQAFDTARLASALVRVALDRHAPTEELRGHVI
jgi:hypothetical protein